MTTTKRNLVITGPLPRLAAALFGAILTTASVCAAQQNPPQLQISTPPDGTVVHPGETVSVTVTSPAGVAFSQVGVIGQDPLGLSDIATSVPATFSFTIPTDIRCGTYMLTADGTTASGESVESATILIDVERPDVPVSLSPLMPGITFEAQGEQSPVVVLATFSDGSILDVTRSSYLAYSSANTGIATVDSNGVVTGVSAGSTLVKAIYSLNGQSVELHVPVAVPSPVLAPSPASLSFGSQNVGTNSAPQILTLTNASSGPMKILSVTTTGDFSETDDCITSSPLAANATCSINVAFTPSAVGNRTGKVSVANSFASIPIGIALSGTGVGQPATATALTSTANPSLLNGSVAFTASVSVAAPGAGTPTGSVVFQDASTVLATVPINTAGQATFSTSSFTVGSHSITATYSGDANFSASASVALNQSVQYAPPGTPCNGDAEHQILQPIHADGTSLFKQGQTAPAKFRVCDANGVSIGTPGVVSSFFLTEIVSGTVTTAVQDIVNTNNPDAAFRWDATDQQWIFNISTQNLSADSTYVYTTALNDGTTIRFQFGLR